MIKRVLSAVFVLMLLATAFAGWRLLGPATAFDGEKRFLYIHTGMNYGQLLDSLRQDSLLTSPSFFDWIARKRDYPSNVKAGKYEIKKGMSLVDIVRMLRNGRQAPIHLVITKIRTRETLASFIGKKFECDSAEAMRFFESNDSLAPFGLDSNNFMTAVMPDSYTLFWNTTPGAIFKKMFAEHKTWWTPLRRQEAAEKGLNPATAYILASIVEEETNAQSDKGKIASVYLNRMAKGMKLSADPTVKFAMGDFELKRIYTKYTLTPSPYNTYLYPGLPPGPICTPSQQTLTDVLESPKTDYLFFVAKPDLSGYSNFSATYKEHLEYRKQYTQALDQRGIGRKTGS
ncbi:MAG TPA: endolytic transglycosylase MltG [Puia sp.]|jgi:UPF0755 protein